MRIGVDFDNTLVCYDKVFYSTARKLQWLDSCDDTSKKGVKSYFIERDCEDKWTELQGIVYGKYICDAYAFEGAREVLSTLGQDHELFLVSHKTRYPIIGEKLDFHQAAKSWLADNHFISLFSEIFFCPEKNEKVERIAQLNLDYFIDDLTSILMHSAFPDSTKGILFGASDIGTVTQCPYYIAQDWRQVNDLLR